MNPTPAPATTTEAEILAAIAEIARRELDHHDPLQPSMRLVEDLGLDSIRLLTLAIAVEDRFRVCLEEEDEAAIVTVGDLVRVVALKTAAGRAEEATGGAS